MGGAYFAHVELLREPHVWLTRLQQPDGPVPRMLRRRCAARPKRIKVPQINAEAVHTKAWDVFEAELAGNGKNGCACREYVLGRLAAERTDRGAQLRNHALR